MIRMRSLLTFALLLLMPASVNAAQAPKSIPFDLAMEAARTALDNCKASGYKVSVTVLDSDTKAIVTLRDGAGANSLDAARRKAYTAAKSGMSSMSFGKSIGFVSTRRTPNDPPTQFGVINGDPELIPFGGGLPIKIGGELMGAIATSGAPGPDKDEACSQAGLTKISDRLK